MPIKGLSDKPRLPRRGKIHLGIKKVGDKGPYPSPTDYFVCPKEVQDVLGEKPTSLTIIFPSDDESQWASQWLKCYSSHRGLVCRGDGETATARVSTATGEIAGKDDAETELREVNCDPAHCQLFGQKRCRPVMNLQFLLPQVPGLGVWQIDTTSRHAMEDINNNIKLIRNACGRIAMIPLRLELVEREVSPDGVKKKIRVLQLTAPYTLMQIQRLALAPAERALVPAPEPEAPEDLFPAEVIGDTDLPLDAGVDEALLQVWKDLQAKVARLKISNKQLSDWFLAKGITAGLKDIEAPVPDARFSQEVLSKLMDALQALEEKEGMQAKPKGAKG